MKAFTVVAAVSFALSTVPALAQQKPPATKPPATQQPAAPQTQKPATPVPPPQATPPRPFPEGAKIAYCSLNAIAATSKEGRAFADKIKTAQESRLKQLQDKNKAMEANKALIDSPSVADDKRAALQKEVARQETEIQRMQQDAQAEMQELQNELQDNFLKRVMPIIQQVAAEKGVQMVLNYQDGMFLWVDTGLDLSGEVSRRLDSATPAAAPKEPNPQPASK
ncbi:MAG: OmpH family outer membrane protein [Bacteroidales bacterium]